MSKKMLAKDELIGLQVKIIKCKDSSWVGKSGIVIDETKNTFLIKTENDKKRIAKAITKFEFEKDGEKITLDGSKIAYRPEDRIKKAR